jgi:hypothetical protein
MIPNTSRFSPDQDVVYSRIFEGVAWPALRPGFVVVVGEHRIESVAGGPKLVVLDEAMDERLWHVVERATALWFYYRPERVCGDARHVAAMQFADERARGQADAAEFRIDHSLLCAMDGPLGYALPLLSQLIDGGRLIIAAGSRLHGELLTVPRNADPAKLLLADYPAVAALAFAVLGLERSRQDGKQLPGSADITGRILG